MKAFLKDNIALVAAIALPALLVVIFGLSTLFLQVSVDGPRHDFLVVTNDDYNNAGIRFSVVDNRLTVIFAPQMDSNNKPIQYSGNPRLWRIHVPEMTAEEISFARPTTQQETNITIPGYTDTITVQNILPGPDGYDFTTDYRNDSNLMTELFAGGSRSYKDPAVGLYKDGRRIPVRIPDSRGYSYNTRFIGWIIEKEAAQ